MEIVAEPINYQALADEIAGRIKSGQLKPGERLLGLREMAIRHGVSAAVARRSFELLEKQGLVVQRQGSGTFVNPSFHYNGAKLFALVTNYASEDIEDYFEPLFEVAGASLSTVMVASLGRVAKWREHIRNLLDRGADALLVDLEAQWFPLEEIRALAGDVPVCFCNRWQWRPEKPERGALVDYAWAYGAGLLHLRSRGHRRIVFLTHEAKPFPHLEEYLAVAAETSGMEFGVDLLRLSSDEVRAAPEATDAKLRSFAATAVMAVADHPLRRMAELCPAAAKLEKIGFFDTMHSKLPGKEFSSFKIDFPKLWETAFACCEPDAATPLNYIKPELVFRNQ